MSKELQQLYARLGAAMQQHFGGEARLAAAAPGRVNLIGEHTDYNDGWVLPCAIDRHTLALARPRPDRQVRIWAADFAQEASFGLDQLSVGDLVPGWLAYVAGMAFVLERSLGPVLPGLDLVIGGNIPQGTGLSSSASLSVALGALWLQAAQLSIDRVQLARWAQQSENDFVGCQCGIMDQMAVSLGSEASAVLLDCRTLQTQAVPIPSGLCLLVIDSRIRRGLVDSAYNQRRHECEQAAALLGVPRLRDASLADLQSPIWSSANARVFKRARHVITENARVHALAQALRRDDRPQIAHLMAESHHSMQQDFEITVPGIDQLVELTHSVVGEAGGVRMTGGGFGGCVVALLPPELIDPVCAEISARYLTAEGARARYHLLTPSPGVEMLGVNQEA